MEAAVEMQQFAQARPRLAAAAMSAPGAPLGHEPRGLERLLDEAVRQRHLMIALRHVAEVVHVIPGVAGARAVAVAVEPQHALHLGYRHRAGRAPTAVIEQPVVAYPLIAQPQSTHRAWAQAENVGHLQPALPPA